MKTFRLKLYDIIDSFLVESDKERSISQLNQDRHLAVSNIIILVESMLGEIVGEGKEHNYDLKCKEQNFNDIITGENKKRQEIIKTAKEYGFNLDI